MSKVLEDIYKIHKVLEKNSYFDISRISNEIYNFSKRNNIPLEDIFHRLEEGEPWEYISQECEFCNNKFQISKNTLIPRIETEDLVDICYKEFSLNKKYSNIIDVGTGTGCIVISLCKMINDKEVRFFATDISKEALDIAKKNALLNKVEKDIVFVDCNLIDDIEIDSDTLLVANLPYIPTEMYKSLDKSVKGYEPKIALDGGPDGLQYYKELLKQLEKDLRSKKNITLVIEIEPSTLENVHTLFSKYRRETKFDFRDKERFLLIHLC